MGQHAQAIREKHTARNVTLIVLAVLIVLLAIAAVFGMQLYKQAKSVKAHESQAISSLSAINDPAKLKDAAALQASIAQAQQQTAQAKQIAHGSLWNVTAKMPFVGSDIATVQGMTEVVDNLAQQTLPSLTTAVQQLAGANLSGAAFLPRPERCPHILAGGTDHIRNTFRRRLGWLSRHHDCGSWQNRGGGLPPEW